MGGQGDPQRIVKEIEIWPYEQMVYVQPRIRPGKWNALNSQGFWDTNRSPDPDENLPNKDFTIPADHEVNLKENEKTYSEYTLQENRKKKLWNMKE